MKLPTHLACLPIIVICFLVGIQSAEALTISPVKVEVTGDPGQTLRGELELLNEQDQPKVFFSSFENFEPSGDTGSPKFIGSAEGLATWLQTGASVPVAAGETVKIPYTITIPPGTEPGGYFAAIFWGEQDPAAVESGEVTIGGKLGVLILLRVAGDIEEAAGISEFALGNNRKIQTILPITFSYRFANSGGDRVVPLGDILIKNTFGGLAETLSANLTEGNVLPNSARKFQSVWGEEAKEGDSVGFLSTAKKQLADFHFGLYKAELAVVYGATNQTASDTFRFIIIPWQLLSLCFIGFIVAVFSLKKYNSWIISKSSAKT